MFYRAFSYHLFVSISFITYIEHQCSSIWKLFNYLFEPEICNFKNQHQCCLFWTDNIETIIREKVQRLLHIKLLIWTARESFNTRIGKVLTEQKKHFMSLKIYAGPLIYNLGQEKNSSRPCPHSRVAAKGPTENGTSGVFLNSYRVVNVHHLTWALLYSCPAGSLPSEVLTPVPLLEIVNLKWYNIFIWLENFKCPDSYII